MEIVEPMSAVDEPKLQNSVNVLSLFSGCGGMDLGFEGGFPVLRASVNEKLTPHFIDPDAHTNGGIHGFVQLRKTRFKTVFANDILSGARVAWVNYFSKRGHEAGDFYIDSIVDLVKKHHDGEKVFPKEVDIVTGGFPCQDFSIAGKRGGFNSRKSHKNERIEGSDASVETRGQLYMWMKEVIEITRPKIFIAENVKGLVNLDDVKEVIQRDFSSAGGNGYLVLEPRVLQAADYGVPQSRERVFFIGIKKSALKEKALFELSKKNVSDEYSPYPQPTHAYTTHDEQLKEFVPLGELFKYLKEPSSTTDPSQMYYSKAKYMGKHCQGQIEVKLDGVAPTIRSEHHGNIEFRRLSKKNGGMNGKELAQGLKERRLTVRECALIQTFPPDYEFVIPRKNGSSGSYLLSPSNAYKIIGNAVPPLLAYHLARRIEEVWDRYFVE